MNNKVFISLLFCLPFIFLNTNYQSTVHGSLVITKEKPLLPTGEGAVQVRGTGYFATEGECGAAGQGAVYAVRMTGDLEGCLYVYIDEYDCSPSGTYREVGREYFVGSYKGKSGTFWTNYKFEARYEGCAAEGAALGLEIFGRCQHPVDEGSGTGIFEGVTGRLDMKDDIGAGNYPYRGHLKF